MSVPAKPGDLIADKLTTRVFNRWLRNDDLADPPSSHHVPINPALVQAHATFSADIYTPVNLAGPYFPNEGTANDPANIYYQYPQCSVVTTLTEDKWCVLQGYVGNGQPALATLMGLTWVKANVTNLAHTHLTVDTGALVSSTSGRATIITPPAATGIGFVLALIGGGGGSTPCLPDVIMAEWQVTATAFQIKTYTISTCTLSDWITVFDLEACT